MAMASSEILELRDELLEKVRALLVVSVLQQPERASTT